MEDLTLDSAPVDLRVSPSPSLYFEADVNPVFQEAFYVGLLVPDSNSAYLACVDAGLLRVRTLSVIEIFFFFGQQ